MPRQNYMTITALDSTQQMFHEFLEHKGISKTSASTDMLEVYMLANDPKLFLELKEKYLKAGIVRELTEKSIVPSPSNDLYLFIKLSFSYARNKTVFDGHETVQNFLKDANVRGHTWFTTLSKKVGMERSKVDKINQAVKNGTKVILLIAISKAAGGNGDIQYQAEIEEVRSFATPTLIKECKEQPQVYDLKAPATIWIKLKNIKQQSGLTASSFQVTSTGRDLKLRMNKGQYRLGYVEKKKSV